MRGRASASSSTDAICALCAFYLARAPLRAPVTSRHFQRTIKTTARVHKPNEATQTVDDSSKSGWGSTGTASAGSGWGGQSSSGWGSAAPSAAPAAQRGEKGSYKSEITPKAFTRPSKANSAPSRYPGSDAGRTARGTPERTAGRGGRNGNSDFYVRSFKPNGPQDNASQTGKTRIQFQGVKAAREPEESVESAGSVGLPKKPMKERWKHLQYRDRNRKESTDPSDESVEHSQRNRRPEKFKKGQIVSWDAAPDEKWASTFTRQNSDTRQQPRVQPEAAPSRGRRNARQGYGEVEQDGASGGDFGRKKRDQNAKVRHQQRKGDEDVDDQVADRMERREKRKADKRGKRGTDPPTPIILPDFISISNLASALRIRADDFAEKLHELGFEDFSNDHVLSAEDAGLIAQEFNFEPTVPPPEQTFEDIVALPEPTSEEKDFLMTRPPVITIMGHVDHGKTTLLDFLRKSSVAAGEHGGITQHIGAFTVNMPSGRTITFLDTPGHAAFLDMRARGANVTDIVILVVAADDSVKPQTLEAIKHAKSANVSMIVAITKVDKEQADIDRVKRDLAQHGVQVEDFGGDIQAIPVSGKTGQGMEDLEDAAIALADVLDVRADATGQVEGWVLESSQKRLGKVATVLIRRGTLRSGDVVVAGKTWTRVRNLRNEAGQVVDEATPGQPVEVDGWDEMPDAGAEVLQAPSLQRARSVAEHRADVAETQKIAEAVAAVNEQRTEQKQQRALAKQQEELDDLKDADPSRAAALQQALDLAKSNEESKFIQVPLVVRADVAGSVEAVSASVLAIGNAEIRSEILRAEVGQVSESDIELAATAKGVIVNFGNPVENAMRRLAETAEVPIIDSNIIYRVTDDLKEFLENRLPKRYSTKVLAEAEIAMVFQYTIKGRGKIPVAGCKVRNGLVERNKKFKILRGGETIHDGELSALKNHKKDVTEVRKGGECGMSFQDFAGFQEGDQIQCYELIEEKTTL